MTPPDDTQQPPGPDQPFDWKALSQSTWVVVLVAIILPPLGIVLAWLKPDWTTTSKWIATVIMGFLLVSRLSSQNASSSSDPASVESQSPDSVAVQPAAAMSAATAVATEKVQAAPQPPKDKVKRGFFGPKKLAYKKRIDLCDNPEAHKNTEMVMEVKTERILLRNSKGDVSHMSCTVFYGDGSFEMQFEIPDDVKQPDVNANQYVNVTFVFSGHVGMPSRVTRIARN